MVARNETDTPRQNETVRDPNSTAVNSFASYRSTKIMAAPPSDDVIVSLANAYENQRARQVTEWEQMGRRALGLVA